ncbi:MAG: glycoside hydrolase family 9 protein, partial [Anaerolineae bacterium]
MLHHTVSRREFLKWSGVGLAGTLLHTGSPWGFPLAPTAPASAGPLALQINGDGVIFDGPFLLAPVDGGGMSIFQNLSLIINDSGFQGFFEGGGYVSFEGLSQQESRVENGVWTFRGRLGHDDLWLEQKISPNGGSVQFDLSLTGSGLSSLRGATFSFFLPAAIFRGQTYVADGQAGTYPSQVPNDARLLAGFRQIELYQDNPALNYRLDAPTEMTLWDGRAWGDPRYQVAVQIPVDTGRAQFTLTPPALDPGPNPPSVRFSRVGYLPDSEKRAVLDVDWRGDWPADMSARLERKTDSGQPESVLVGSFVIDGDECWRRFASFDFSRITETGEYRVNWAGGQTDWFPIAPNIFNGRWFTTLDKFLPLQMCHIAVDLGDGLLAHDTCHLDDAVQAPPNYFGADFFISYESNGTPASPGETIVCNVGGWHDAGDYDVNVTAQAFVTHILALAWEEFAPRRDVNTLDLEGRQMRMGQSNGVPDLLEQVEWGVRWLLSMQQADGRVYVGVVARPAAYNSKQLPEDVTDGVPDTGDERDLFVDYHSDAQLKFIIATAAASRALRGTNDTLAEAAWQAALRAWSYFQANPEVYRPTVYFYEPDAPGREGLIIAAAAELYLTDPDPTYLSVISQFESYLQKLSVLWPAPYITDYPGFWYVPPFLARLFPRLTDGSLKDAVAQAIARAADALRDACAERPFPHHCW